MKSIGLVPILATALGLLFFPRPSPTPPAPAAQALPQATCLTGDKALEHLKAAGQYESLQAAITAARYAVRTDSSNQPPVGNAGFPVGERAGSKTGATAVNPANGFSATFTPEGLRLRVRGAPTNAPPVAPGTRTVRGNGPGPAGSGRQKVEPAPDAPIFISTWRLASVGYGAAQTPVPAGELKVTGQRAEIIRGGSATPHSALRTPQLTEWFHNTPGGLEHGFTLAERPTGNTSPPQPSTLHPPPSAVLSTLRSAATEDGLRRTGQHSTQLAVGDRGERRSDAARGRGGAAARIARGRRSLGALLREAQGPGRHRRGTARKDGGGGRTGYSGRERRHCAIPLLLTRPSSNKPI